MVPRRSHGSLALSPLLLLVWYYLMFGIKVCNKMAPDNPTLTKSFQWGLYVDIKLAWREFEEQKICCEQF